MRRRLAVVLLLTTAALSACGGRPEARPAGIGGELTVFAAASLTETFTAIGERFESEHPGVRVTFSFAASSALAAQVTSGAPADVFAAASPEHLDRVDAAARPRIFARNVLQIAVPAGNPAGITGPADLADPDRTIALCAEQVPCGAATRRALAAAGVTAAPDTLEQDVKATLAKVILGEVDAALVYRTDVAAADDDVDGIDFPESAEAVNDYPIAALADAPNPATAAAFVDFVLGPTGRTVLVDAGFEVP